MTYQSQLYPIHCFPADEVLYSCISLVCVCSKIVRILRIALVFFEPELWIKFLTSRNVSVWVQYKRRKSVIYLAISRHMSDPTIDLIYP